MSSRLVVITPIFNFCEYEIIYSNWQKYANSITKQGAELITIEVLFPGQKARLSGPGKIITLSASSVLWQKEAAINAGIKQLPPDVDLVAWVDGDIILPNKWIEETIKQLQSYLTIQLFSKLILEFPLSAKRRKFSRHCREYGWCGGTDKLPLRQHGGAWAARREFIEEYRLYDRTVLGGGDSVFALAVLDQFHRICHRGINRATAEHSKRWAQRITACTKGKINCVHGVARHLFHGCPSRRQYRLRHRRLTQLRYKPAEHVVYEDNGLLKWADTAPEMLKQRALEFFSYRDDNSEQ